MLLLYYRVVLISDCDSCKIAIACGVKLFDILTYNVNMFLTRVQQY